ncbi:MAG: fructose-bisphosphate aldolase class I [Oceanicoccus sp.]|jgi:fructose-bisphosphate aldolase class I
MDLQMLESTAQAMVAPGKGVLAIDESHGTCTKRFEAYGVKCDEESRRAYRGLLVTAPGIEEAISGYIMYDETLRQSTNEGVPFPQFLSSKGMIPGIKVDTGAKDLALHEGEKVTEGLDGLRDRLKEYFDLGARFAKWRSVITIGEGMPSQACIMANAHGLARYAALCQEAGLVPMVEPEILIEGDHSIERCAEVSEQVWTTLFEQLIEQGVHLEGTILKTSMIISGKGAADRADAQTVAEMTVKALKAHVPENLAGVVFLSGGQSPKESTLHLDLMNKIGDMPWPLSFSYGRAIQGPTLDIWAKDHDAVEAAQASLFHRAQMNGLAARAEYNPEIDA